MPPINVTLQGNDLKQIRIIFSMARTSGQKYLEDCRFVTIFRAVLKMGNGGSNPFTA